MFGVQEQCLPIHVLTNRSRRLGSVLMAVACLMLIGCDHVAGISGATWHQKYGWQAEDYFDDAQVIALCRAIEADDIAEIDRLVAAGANVNAKGKGNMTPLLWAYPDNKLARFKRLLEHGADPNIVFESDFGTHSAIMAGESVTHLACETSYPGYFEAVFEHGGDPNLEKKTVALRAEETPIFSVIKGSAGKRLKKVNLLIEKGANLDHTDAGGMTPAMTAVGWFGQFEIALMLLEAGANPTVYQDNDLQKLTHVVVRQERRLPDFTPEQKADYDELVKWLEEHGESLDEARADIKRWDSWSRSTGEFQRETTAEIAARKQREAREKAADGEKQP